MNRGIRRELKEEFEGMNSGFVGIRRGIRGEFEGNSKGNEMGIRRIARGNRYGGVSAYCIGVVAEMARRMAECV